MEEFSWLTSAVLGSTACCRPLGLNWDTGCEDFVLASFYNLMCQFLKINLLSLYRHIWFLWKTLIQLLCSIHFIPNDFCPKVSFAEYEWCHTSTLLLFPSFKSIFLFHIKWSFCKAVIAGFCLLSNLKNLSLLCMNMIHLQLLLN